MSRTTEKRYEIMYYRRDGEVMRVIGYARTRRVAEREFKKNNGAEIIKITELT